MLTNETECMGEHHLGPAKLINPIQQLGLCTHTVANKLLVGGIFQLSVTFGTSLAFFTRSTFIDLWLSQGHRKVQSGGNVSLALSILRSPSHYLSH